LLGLERDFTGSVLVNGAEIRTVSQRWLRNRMAVVDQEATLFSGTVRQNLEVGLDRPPSLQEIEGALEFASAGRFVQALPGGLDYELTEGAQNLSGGQRQRLAVARAVLRAPAIAVFDEPTSALDSEAAVEMERKLIAWGRDRLVLIVTHHLFTARVSDSIIVLNQGRLVSVGGHDQLLASCNVYRTLWNDYNRA
jgi:ABC-type multidrug transport system fused ATPase/permease subunit